VRKKATGERDTLVRLQEARRRDMSRRKSAMAQLDQLTKMEVELLDEGRGDVSEKRRLLLARRVREVRGQIRALNQRIETIYDKRIAVYNQHLAALETVVELTDEPVPARDSVERIAIEARTKLDDLEKASELGTGVAPMADAPQPDDEERAILEEMERRAEGATKSKKKKQE
jgi:hypothetical protein